MYSETGAFPRSEAPPGDLAASASAAALRPRPFGIEEEAFRAANVYRGWGELGTSSTFKFSAISAYETVDIMDFIIMSLRNRARSDNTLSRVTKLMRDFIVFASSPDPPFPFHGGHR